MNTLGRALRLARLSALVVLGLLTVGAGRSAWVEHQQREAGARLFDGRSPLTARIAGHDQALPSAASRCINCHGVAADALARQPADRRTGRASGAAGLPPSALAGRLAPELNARNLRALQARRGGPPSRYDAASLCRLLRTGTDPAWVLLPRSMPRYAVSDADCDQLWAHLAG